MADGEGPSGSQTKEKNAEYIVDPATRRMFLRGRFLGQGAHATVYLATDLAKSSEKQYAVKIMTLEPAKGKQDRERLQKERSREVKLSRVMKEVNIHNLMRHKNVVRLESYFENNSKFYMVLEHCEMNNLAHLLRQRRRFEEDESRNFLRQLLAGLQHIHERGIIHRDLKPANIYLTHELVLKIGDFGLADRFPSVSKGICGTPNYISPEVLNEQGYTTAVDIWATGCIVYHMITGRLPFEADTQAATYDLIRKHHYAPIPPSQAGAALRHLINWMMAFRPEDRPSIPFIFSHTWMKRNRKGKSAFKTNPTWFNYIPKGKNTPQCIPLAEMSLESCASVGSECYKVLSKTNMKNEEKRDLSFWKVLLEKAKVRRKIISYEDICNKQVFHHLKSKVHFTVNSSKREPLRRVVEEVLRGLPQPTNKSDNVSHEELLSPIFVAKWIDYSNKYGFGYELTDGTHGIFFNDCSQIIMDSQKTYVTWFSKRYCATYSFDSVPSFLQEKIMLLTYFADYMNSNLSNTFTEDNKTKAAEGQAAVFLRHWMRNEKVILFEMMNGQLQINFFRDHYKLILYQDNFNQVLKETMLLIVDEENKVRMYNLSKLGRNGCPEDIVQHLVYIHTLL